MARKYDSFEYTGGTAKHVRSIVKTPRFIGVKPFTAAKAKKVRIEIDGATVTAEVIPYTYGTFKRYAHNKTEEYGEGIYLQECERALYEYGGKVYKHSKYRDEQGEWHSTYVPYSGGAYGRCGTGLDPIQVIDGIIAA